MANILAIVGRPNVGKSTLFNRLVGERKAIMDDQSGVTRDRHYGYGEWCGKNFTVVDTGGYVVGSDDIFEEEIRKQVTLAMDEATVIIFMVDVREGLHPLDEEFANVLRRTKKPVYVVANKADNTLNQNMAGEFYAMGFDQIISISSQSGSGTGELLDEIVTHFPEDQPENPDIDIPRIAILGRPNVGKSSLLNVLLNTDRSIVTDLAGTTRDAIDTRYNAYGMEFILTDTAGIRKKSVVREDIEFYSVLRSINALERSDICMVLIDAQNGLEAQDMTIIGLAEKNKKGIVVVVNKWDLVQKTTKTAKEFEDAIRKRMAPIDYFPIVFASVLEKQRIHKAMETAIEVCKSRAQRISTSVLNDKLLPEIENYPPPALNGKYVKIKYITQLHTRNPSFAFFCNYPRYIIDSYQRFLENKIRKHFGFDGVPLTLYFREK